MIPQGLEVFIGCNTAYNEDQRLEAGAAVIVYRRNTIRRERGVQEQQLKQRTNAAEWCGGAFY